MVLPDKEQGPASLSQGRTLPGNVLTRRMVQGLRVMGLLYILPVWCHLTHAHLCVCVCVSVCLRVCVCVDSHLRVIISGSLETSGTKCTG